MTSIEFRAWLQGYSEQISGAPTAEQWQAIRARMLLVSDLPPAVNVYHHPPPPVVNVPYVTVAPQYPEPTWEVVCSKDHLMYIGGAQ